MVYGRVDVYWPEGPIESYHLDKPVIAVGRSSGNDVVLDTTAISRYHVTFTFKNQQVLLEDLQSANGTYVDGVRLEANKPYLLRGGEEIQLGDILLIFHPPVDIAAVSGDTTQRIILSQPTYGVELEGPSMSVAPGAHVQATLKINNHSDEPDHYFIEVEGLPTGWVRVDRVEADVDAGTQTQVVISFKPLRRSESLPGEYPFTVRVRSRSKPAQTIDAPAVLHVLPFSGFGIALGETRIEGRASFKLYLHNQGNAPLMLSLHGTDSAQVLNFRLPRTTLTLGPGEHQTVIGTISPRRNQLFGQGHEREFMLVARAHDASNFQASVPGTYVEKNHLPTWVPMLILPAAATIFALFVLGIILLILGNRGDAETPAVQPVINTFSVVTPIVALDQSVEVAWTVTDVESAELVVSRAGAETRYPLVPDQSTYSLPPLEQTGLFTFTLEAQAGDNVTTQSAMVEVRPLVSLTLEVPSGSEQLIRNVEQNVRVSWNADGALSVEGGYSLWAENPDTVAPLLPAPRPLSGAMEVTIIPSTDQSEWLLTLYAEGQDGVLASVTQKLPIENPVCELKTPRTVVRSGPGATYPAVIPPLQNTSGGNLSFSPIARDPSGQWMQVEIGVENTRLGWVLLGDFECTNFDPARLVETNDFPAPPTAPPSSTETAVPASPTATPGGVTPTPLQQPGAGATRPPQG